MTRLSPHFTLAELTRSEAADGLGDANKPTEAHLCNLRLLALGLEQIRAAVGKPLRVTSGYRNPRVNAAVGGVRDSAHALGLAADLDVDGLTPMQLAVAIRDSGVRFDQLILEQSRGVVHVSFDPRLRQQVKRQPGAAGSRVYPGLT
jgi:putative chitinase